MPHVLTVCRDVTGQVETERCSESVHQHINSKLWNNVEGVTHNIETTYAIKWEYTGVTVTCGAGCR
jgi:hypothetical protein